MKNYLRIPLIIISIFALSGCIKKTDYDRVLSDLDEAKKQNADLKNLNNDLMTENTNLNTQLSQVIRENNSETNKTQYDFSPENTIYNLDQEFEIEARYFDSLRKNRFENAFRILEGDISLLKYRLSWHQVGQLSEDELSLLKNVILAKNGYIFDDSELSTFFERFDWYIPVNNSAESRFSDEDSYNLNFIDGIMNVFSTVSSSITDDHLVGVWHPSSIIPSARADVFVLFDDHSFIWDSSPMYIYDRLSQYSGNWKLEENTLVLNIDEYKWIAGGRIVPDTMNYPNGLVDGTMKIIPTHDQPIQIRLPISENVLDPETAFEFKPDGMARITFGNMQYWNDIGFLSSSSEEKEWKEKLKN